MTNKEAIAELKAMPIIYPITNGENDRASRLMQARDMAIKALKQEPCKNTIDRQAVLDIVDSYSESQSNIEDVTQDIVSDIMVLPFVNLQEPKTGEWNTFELFQSGIKETWYECPKCKWSNALLIPRNYCPNCGAKMVEPQESEKDEHMTADEFAELFTESED